MSNNYDVIKKLLDTDDTEKIRTTVENFQLVEMPDKVVEYVTAKLLSEDKGVRDTISRILSENKNNNIPKYIVPYISSEKIGTRNLAGEILLNRKEDSIKPMLSYLPDANDDDQKFIIDILGLIGHNDPAEEIISVLKYTRDENVILACIEALGNIKAEDGVDEIISVYEQNELFRPTIIEALGKIGSHQCISFINTNYYGVDELTKFSLIESLGEIGNSESFEMLINDIKYLEGAYKWVAIETIGKLQEKLSLILPLNTDLKNSLIETLENADVNYKKSAIRLVAQFDGKDIIPNLLDIYGIEEEINNKLKDYFIKYPNVFFENVISFIKDNPKNLKAIVNLIKEMIQIDGGMSLQALNEIERHSFVESLTVFLNNPDEEVRASSMELLFYLDAETALMFTDTMLEDTNIWNRLRLLEIIQYGDDERIIELIKTLANDEDEMISENASTILSERGINNLEPKD